VSCAHRSFTQPRVAPEISASKAAQDRTANPAHVRPSGKLLSRINGLSSWHGSCDTKIFLFISGVPATMKNKSIRISPQSIGCIVLAAFAIAALFRFHVQLSAIPAILLGLCITAYVQTHRPRRLRRLDARR